MVDVTYQMVLSTLQTVGLLVGVFYYIISLNNQQKTRELALKTQETTLETRKVQMAQDIISKLTLKSFYTSWMDIVYNQPYEDFDDWFEKYGPYTNMPAYLHFCYVVEQYDMAGFALKQGLVPAEYTYSRHGDTAIRVWDTVEPIVKRLREASPSGKGRYYSLWDNFEFMANEYKRVRSELYGVEP